ncbi:MAG TPA: hypothetical protein VE715_16400, partial [Blastocatellia bacterium]|nr:hypothetical protein [Blastocatellia bacterium]
MDYQDHERDSCSFVAEIIGTVQGAVATWLVPMMYSLQGSPGRYRSLYRTGGAFPYTELQAD